MDPSGFLEAHKRIVVAAFLGAVLVAGILVFKDYGVAWDEPVQREYGTEVYQYVVHHDQALFMDRHRYYGPVVELALYGLEKGLRLTDTRSIYMMRHLVSFLVLWLGVFCFYLLAERVFRSWKIGLVGSAMLVLSPRIFAHSFYNTKDVPFLAVFVAAGYTMLRYLDAKTLRAAVLHGVVSAVLIDTRIIGVMVPVLTFACWAYDLLPEKGRPALGGAASRASGAGSRWWTPATKRAVASFAAYVGVLVGLTVILWPTLWRDPFWNFIRVFESMSSFPWEATVLYLGKYVWSTKLPWHYTLVWMGISTPLGYIIFFGVGLVACGFRRTRNTIVILGWFFLPLIYYTTSGVVLYDEWRHSFFIYPAFLLIALGGLDWLWRLARGGSKPGARGTRRGIPSRIAAAGLVLVVALSLASTFAFMIRHHPYENVFFNSLVGGVKGASGRFEMDYWGLSYRKGLEYLAATDPSPAIPIFAATPPGRYNIDILRPADRKRLIPVTDHHQARYYVTNFRWEENKFSPTSEVFSVKVDGVKLMAVYRL